MHVMLGGVLQSLFRRAGLLAIQPACSVEHILPYSEQCQPMRLGFSVSLSPNP